MSSLSNLPYGKIFDYWYEKLAGNRYKIRFIVTKAIEVYIFKRNCSRNINKYECNEFPISNKNSIRENPIISIVIPTYLRTIKDITDTDNLISSIGKQTRKPDYIIVVDDFSPLEYNYQDNITTERLDKNSGPAKARNIGKQIALQNLSDIIVFTDTDCILSNNWIETIEMTVKQENEFHILSGNTISFDKHWFGIYHNINGTLNGRKFKNSERLLYGTTANLAITHHVAKAIHFNENFPLAAGEDIDFCFSANQKGFAIKHVNNMTVHHNFGYTKNHFDSFKRFRGIFKKYGQGEKILLKEIPNYYSYFDMTEEISAERIGLTEN